MAVRRLRVRFIAKVVGLMGLLTVLGVLAAQFYLEWRAEAMLAEAKAQGEPVTLAELDAFYPSVLPSENAAPIYTKAFAEANIAANVHNDLLPLMGKWELPAPYVPIPAENLAACEQCLAENATCLRLFREAAEMPATRFPLALQSGFGVPLDHLAQMRHGGRLLCLQALVASERGEAEQAIDALLACLTTGDALRSEPVYISQLVRGSMLTTVPDFAERVVARAQPTDEQLARLIDAILAAEDPEAEWRGMVGERCMGVAEFDQIAAGGTLFSTFRASASERVVNRLASYTGILAADRRTYIELQTRLVESALLPYHQRIAAEGEVRERIHHLSFTEFTTKVLMNFDEPARSFVRHATCMRTAAVGLAIERYRRAQGALPDSLDNLAPAYLGEVPSDPYSGGPFHYARTEHGAVVYSVASNGVDDGGNEQREEESGAPMRLSRYGSGPRREPMDIAFRVEQ